MNDKNLFLSLKSSDEILNKLKSKGFLASCVSTCHFATLYTTLRLFDWSFRASRPYDDIICVAHFLFDLEYFAISQTFVLYEDYEDRPK